MSRQRSDVCTARPYAIAPEVRDVAVGKVRAVASLVTLDHDRPADPPTLLGLELLRVAVENA